MAYWKSQNLAFINQVKVVSIELCSGSNGFDLARYILEHAQNLKKLGIIHSAEQSNAIRELNESKRVSNAAFVFEEDRQRGTRKQGTPAFWSFAQTLRGPCSIDSIRQ